MTGSYASGTSTVPLLGDTIGANLRPDGGALRRPRGAGRVAAPAAADLPRAGRRGRRLAARAARRAGVAQGRPGRHLGAQLRRVGVSCSTRRPSIGAILVNINPAYRTHELATCCSQAGISLLVSAPAFKTSDYRGDGRRGARPVPGAARRSSSSATPAWDALLADGGPGRRRAVDVRAPGCRFDDPINIQYTSGHDRASRRARRSRTTTSSTTASSSARSAATPRQDRVCIPVPFYHCFGMVMGNLGCHLARRVHGHPGAGLRPARDPAGGRRTSGAPRCTACRRCSSPSWADPTSPTTTCPRCAPGSWPARRARSR